VITLFARRQGSGAGCFGVVALAVPQPAVTTTARHARAAEMRFMMSPLDPPPDPQPGQERHFDAAEGGLVPVVTKNRRRNGLATTERSVFKTGRVTFIGFS
jgi:hypothetical protein